MEEDVDSVPWLRWRRMECSGTEKDVAWDGAAFLRRGRCSSGELLPKRVRHDHLRRGKGAIWLRVERMRRVNF